MARLIWTEPAIQDLNGIAEHIALDNVDAAKKLVRNVFKTVERLEQHPMSGRKPPELRNSPCREIVAGPCRIFYRADNKNIYILYVMRSEHQLRTFMLDERRKTS